MCRVRTMASATSSPAFRLRSAALLGRWTAACSRAFRGAASVACRATARRSAGSTRRPESRSDLSDLGDRRGDGAIYVTDGSRANTPDLWLADLMQNRAPSGRLIACDSQLGSARVCADDLAWPSGAVVSHDGDEVWVCESWAHRLTALSRANDRRRAIVKNYAGYPARISRGLDGDYWLAFFGLRTQLTEFVLREREFCEAMMKTVPPELWIGPTLGRAFQLSRADPDRPHQEARHPEALGAARAPTAWSLGSTRRARRAKACTAVSTAESTASPRSARSARA